MTNHTIIKVLREASLALNHEFNPSSLRFVEANNRDYTLAHFQEFKRDLLEAGSRIRILFFEQHVKKESLLKFISDNRTCALVFRQNGEALSPILLQPKGKEVSVIEIHSGGNLPYSGVSLSLETLLTDPTGNIEVFVLHSYQSLVSEYAYEGDAQPEPLSPVRRFFRLLTTEKRDVLYILFYSVVIGLTALILPVGIQNTVELVSGGVFFSSIYVLIAAVILGVLFTGILQIFQISLVENLQRRFFTKAALEFAFRIPRIRIESILNNYAPELVNRFFDVITLQKGLPKLLIDITASGVQILFGLILLSLYHPLFVFFSALLILILFLIFWFTAPGALRSSINESKYKYKVVHWLEELARAINSFKLAGNTDLPTRRADNTVNNYLKYRKAHFTALVTQFSFIVLFKTAVTATLLIVGTVLVVNREITLGQFVASEVVIILILNAVEKVITYMDVVYDLFTAVDKVAQITDLPLEKVGGIDFPRETSSGYSLELKDVKYKYPGKPDYVLDGINLAIPSGSRICISGPENSGKTTLTNLIAGLQSGYEGILTINNYSLRDLDLTHLRDKIAKNISPEDIFDGTILENITLGSPVRKVEDALSAISRAHLADEINKLPGGLDTHLVSGGKGLSSSFIHKLILARCLAKKPALIILNDFFAGLKRQKKLELLKSVIDHEAQWTLIAVSNDPLVMAACDSVIVLNNGRIADRGHFDELVKRGTINNYIE